MLGESQEELPGCTVIVVFDRQGQRGLHQLQGPDAVALGRIHVFSAASMRPPLKFAGDDKSLMVDRHVRLCSRVQ